MGFELFTRNVKYLFKYNLKHMWQRANPDHDDELMSYTLSVLRNEKELVSGIKLPRVLSITETVDKLNRENISFCRFGDGEIALMHEKKGGVFQRYEPRLAEILKEAASVKDEKFRTGLFYYFYNLPDDNLHLRQELFFSGASIRFREMLSHYVDPDWLYGDALISMPYHLFREFDFEKFYEEVSKLWAGKEIVMICGKTVFDKIKHNIFSSAAHIEYIYGPRINAFDEYDALLKKALATDPKKTKFLILGQTATALAYDIAQHGHRAIDIGHLAKDYNSWKLGEDLYQAGAIRNFYDKD